MRAHFWAGEPCAQYVTEKEDDWLSDVPLTKLICQRLPYLFSKTCGRGQCSKSLPCWFWICTFCCKAISPAHPCFRFLCCGVGFAIGYNHESCLHIVGQKRMKSLHTLVVQQKASAHGVSFSCDPLFISLTLGASASVSVWRHHVTFADTEGNSCSRISLATARVHSWGSISRLLSACLLLIFFLFSLSLSISLSLYLSISLSLYLSIFLWHSGLQLQVKVRLQCWCRCLHARPSTSCQQINSPHLWCWLHTCHCIASEASQASQSCTFLLSILAQNSFSTHCGLEDSKDWLGHKSRGSSGGYLYILLRTQRTYKQESSWLGQSTKRPQKC